MRQLSSRCNGAFGDFHAYFAPLFGRRESREHSRNYLRALLVQSGERRNAENLSESVGVSARAMQRFLTSAFYMLGPGRFALCRPGLCFFAAWPHRIAWRWRCPVVA